MFLEGDDSLPEPDAALGFEDDDGEERSTAPSVADLLLNADVQAVLEAAEGLRPVALTPDPVV
jgi:hypothetical protein